MTHLIFLWRLLLSLCTKMVLKNLMINVTFVYVCRYKFVLAANMQGIIARCLATIAVTQIAKSTTVCLNRGNVAPSDNISSSFHSNFTPAIALYLKKQSHEFFVLLWHQLTLTLFENPSIALTKSEVFL